MVGKLYLQRTLQCCIDEVHMCEGVCVRGCVYVRGVCEGVSVCVCEGGVLGCAYVMGVCMSVWGCVCVLLHSQLKLHSILCVL